MTASKLSLYNGALRRLGERKLSTVTDNVPERHHLDTIWDEDPVQLMLEKYNWGFAHKAMEWNYNSAIEPDFGHRYAFDVPSDYVRLAALCSDEYFESPLRQYVKEANYFFCDYQTIYLKYVSSASDYGKDYSKWSKLFENMTATYIAQELAPTLNKSKSDVEKLEKEMKKYSTEARSMDAMEQPTRFPPQGSWTRSRRQGRTDGSNRGPLIG